MKIRMEVRMPNLPNFLRVKRGDEKGEGICVPIEELDNEEWDEFLDAFTEALIDHRNKRIAAKEPIR